MKELLRKHFDGNRKVRVTILVLVIVFVLGVTFKVGEEVGSHRANFTKNWGERYSNNFGSFGRERDSRFGFGMMGGNFRSVHGAIGKVLTVSSSTIMMLDNNDNIEKSILINKDTVIRNGRDNASTTSLKSDNFVMVIGEPNENGQIVAKLIRVMSNSTSTFPFPMYNMMFNR